MNFRKQSFLTAILVGAGFIVTAQKNQLTIVHGHVDKENTKKISLYQVVEGEMSEYASTRLDADNNFAFALPTVQEGFYYLGENLRGRSVPHRFYLKPGDAVTLDIHQTTADLAGNSPENRILNQWQKLYAEIAVPAIQFWNDRTTYVTFFPALKSFLPKAAAFQKKINTTNRRFNSLLSMVVDSDIEYAAIQFLFTPRGAHPSKEEYPDYYRSIIQKAKFCDGRILQLGDAVQRIERYALFYSLNSGVKVTSNGQMEHTIRAICNDTLKGIYAMSKLRNYKSLEKMQTEFAPYKKYFVTDSLKAKYLRYESGLSTYAKGEKAYNFSYPDVNGDTVTLESLKGKIVLVDTWATWCMPCKAEIPHLKKLEEELRDRDIAFVSLSVDEAKDEAKWMEFVKKEKLGGIQLYAKGFSEFTKYYKINAIPRFLIFDKEGKIVTVDSPRPSNPELKELLLKLVGE